MFSPQRPKPIAFQLKKLSAAVATAMLFSQAHAAGWGDLTVLSSLGQPLRADIELISTGHEDGPLTVKLAGVDAYRRANIEFNPVLMSLRFSVEQRGGRQFVHVTSTQPVNEPFVDMLLELSSSSGRVVREFVFLLDPASLDAPQVAATAPTNHAAALPAPAGKPAPSAPARQPAQKAVASKPAMPNTAPSKPRLTLSGVTATSATDGKAGVIALDDYATMEKQVAEANARVKALEQKVSDLQKLLEVTNTLLTELQKQNEAAAAASKPASQPEAPAATPAAAPVAETKPAVQEAPAVTAPTKAVPPAPAAPKPAAPPEEETDYLIPGAALLAALLGAAGIYSSRRRKARKAMEAGFHDAMHGDKPTTSTASDGATTALATGLLLPTAIGNTHEVDPLAEADVYIAYGRDMQAEDILKEALNKQPDRHAVRVKLLSIYAGRKDLQSFDALARELHAMTKGAGEDWLHAAELGREIAPANPLYAVQAESLVAPEPEPALVLERVDAAAPASPLPDLAPTEEIVPAALEAAPGDVDFDLDNLEAHVEPLPVLAPVADDAPASGPGPIDFDFTKREQQAEEDLAPIPELPVAALDEPKADGNLMDFDFLKPEPKAEAVPQLPPALLEEAKPEEALLDFDFLKPAADNPRQ
jgi:pilus assembly protein FimV